MSKFNNVLVIISTLLCLTIGIIALYRGIVKNSRVLKVRGWFMLAFGILMVISMLIYELR